MSWLAAPSSASIATNIPAAISAASRLDCRIYVGSVEKSLVTVIYFSLNRFILDPVCYIFILLWLRGYFAQVTSLQHLGCRYSSSLLSFRSNKESRHESRCSDRWSNFTYHIRRKSLGIQHMTRYDSRTEVGLKVFIEVVKHPGSQFLHHTWHISSNYHVWSSDGYYDIFNWISCTCCISFSSATKLITITMR